MSGPPPVFAKLEVGFHARGANQVRPEKSGVLLNDGRAPMTPQSGSRTPASVAALSRSPLAI
jgi:hypothetical protein